MGFPSLQALERPAWVLCAVLALAPTVAPGAGAGQPAERVAAPQLPDRPYRYAGITLPSHFTDAGPEGIAATENTPADNRLTDAAVTLGRVLFYDTRLSANGRVSCASCHQQAHGFGDPRRFSVGYNGARTPRRSMRLTNARYYAPGRFFWDERADTLEAQVLVPLTDPIEMGLPPGALARMVTATSYYPPLFAAAFGTPAVTEGRIARALAQFVRALVSADSRYDRARMAGPPESAAFRAQLTEPERLGHQLFVTVPAEDERGAGCARCHATDAQVSLSPRNIGLDPAGVGDQGAGDGRFKAPSLRNVGVGAPYMHDGRFSTLREVVEHYDRKVRANPFLDLTLIDRRRAVTGGPVTPVPLELTEAEVDALVAFLHTLTDPGFLADPRFSDPFAP